MKKNLLLAGAALVGLMLASSNAARADFGTASILANDIITGTNVQGTWHVTLTNNGPGDVWNVRAWADGVSVPTDIAEHINISFFASLANANSASNALYIISKTDATQGSVVGVPGGAWDTTASFGAPSGGLYKLKQFNDSGNEYLDPLGGNVFHGTITLGAGLSAQVKAVSARLDDSTVSWRGSAPVTPVPEASSLALLLPGLLPIGIVIRRRRQGRS